MQRARSVPLRQSQLLSCNVYRIQGATCCGGSAHIKRMVYFIFIVPLDRTESTTCILIFHLSFIPIIRLDVSCSRSGFIDTQTPFLTLWPLDKIVSVFHTQHLTLDRLAAF